MLPYGITKPQWINMLTHYGLVIPHVAINQDQHWLRKWLMRCLFWVQYIDGLVQDCSNSSALAMELLQSCTRPSTCIIIFSCDQAAIWLVQSVCVSVRPSVTPLSPCSHHRIIMKFTGVITNDKSDVHAKVMSMQKVKVKGQGHRGNTQLNRFRTVTPVWIHIWWWNDAYSLMMLRRGDLLFLKVIHQISRSQGSKKHNIWPRLGVSGL